MRKRASQLPNATRHERNDNSGECARRKQGTADSGDQNRLLPHALRKTRLAFPGGLTCGMIIARGDQEKDMSQQ